MTISQIRLRRGSTVDWETHNPVLASGEPGYDSTLKRLKVGDGASPWTDLPFLVPLVTGIGSPEGVIIAGTGTLYLNLSGGAGATLWVKEAGTGDTGWAAK